MGEINVDRCDSCGKTLPVTRKYYHYDVKCDCCRGGRHFAIVHHCGSCVPKPPAQIRIVLENIKPLDE